MKEYALTYLVAPLSGVGRNTTLPKTRGTANRRHGYVSRAPAVQATGLRALLRRLKARYLALKNERAAIAELWALDDRMLADIGLNRTDIPFMVKRKMPLEGSASAQSSGNQKTAQILELKRDSYAHKMAA